MRDLMDKLNESDAGRLGFTQAAYLFQVFNNSPTGEALGEVVKVEMGKDAYLEVTVKMKDSGKVKVFRFSYVDQS